MSRHNQGVTLAIKRFTRLGRAREWLGHRIARLACFVEGTHFWTAPIRLQQVGPRRKARLCSRCGKIGKPFFSP